MKYFFKYFIYNSQTNRLKSSFIYPLLTIIVGSFVIMLSFSIMEGFSKEIKETINFFDKERSLTINKKIFLNNSYTNKIDSLIKYLKRKGNFYNAYEERFMFINSNNNQISCKVYGIKDFNNFNPKNFLIDNNYLIKDGSQYCFVGYNQFFNSNIDKFNVVNLNAILDFKNLNSYPKKKYIIKGIIKTNIPKYDNSIFINYDSLLFNKNVFLKINLNHPLTINSLTDLNEKFGEGILYHNNTEFSELFYAINFEKMFYGFVGLSIILISSLMILGFNIISITENSSKIGMLNALGLSNKKISLYYVFYGLLISFSGFLISLLCFFIIFYFDKNFNIMHYIFNPEVYFNFKLNINYEVLINVFLLNTVLIILSCLYPIHKMSKLDIIDSISNRV